MYLTDKKKEEEDINCCYHNNLKYHKSNRQIKVNPSYQGMGVRDCGRDLSVCVSNLLEPPTGIWFDKSQFCTWYMIVELKLKPQFVSKLLLLLAYLLVTNKYCLLCLIRTNCNILVLSSNKKLQTAFFCHYTLESYPEMTTNAIKNKQSQGSYDKKTTSNQL